MVLRVVLVCQGGDEFQVTWIGLLHLVRICVLSCSAVALSAPVQVFDGGKLHGCKVCLDRIKCFMHQGPECTTQHSALKALSQVEARC